MFESTLKEMKYIYSNTRILLHSSEQKLDVTVRANMKQHLSQISNHFSLHLTFHRFAYGSLLVHFIAVPNKAFPGHQYALIKKNTLHSSRHGVEDNEGAPQPNIKGFGECGRYFPMWNFVS